MVAQYPSSMFQMFELVDLDIHVGVLDLNNVVQDLTTVLADYNTSHLAIGH